MLKWIVAAIAVILLIAGVAWMNWRNSPMREIERSSAAVENAKSWHYHTVRTYTGLPSNTFDKDTFCPSFQHTIQSGTDHSGAPIVFDTIIYFGRSYSRVPGQWASKHRPPGRPQCPRLAAHFRMPERRHGQRRQFAALQSHHRRRNVACRRNARGWRRFLPRLRCHRANPSRSGRERISILHVHQRTRSLAAQTRRTPPGATKKASAPSLNGTRTPNRSCRRDFRNK